MSELQAQAQAAPAPTPAPPTQASQLKAQLTEATPGHPDWFSAVTKSIHTLLGGVSVQAEVQTLIAPLEARLNAYVDQELQALEARMFSKVEAMIAQKVTPTAQ